MALILIGTLIGATLPPATASSKADTVLQVGDLAVIPAAKIGCSVSRERGHGRVICFKNLKSLRGTYGVVMYADRLQVIRYAGSESRIVFTAKQPR